MAAKMALPANANMAAFVCNGRNLPNAIQGKPPVKAGKTRMTATMTPTNMATKPQIMVAVANMRTMPSS